jgi:hypothetical protein
MPRTTTHLKMRADWPRVKNKLKSKIMYVSFYFYSESRAMNSWFCTNCNKVIGWYEIVWLLVDLDLNSGIKINNFFYQLKDLYSKQGDSTGDCLFCLCLPGMWGTRSPQAYRSDCKSSKWWWPLLLEFAGDVGHAVSTGESQLHCRE